MVRVYSFFAIHIWIIVKEEKCIYIAYISVILFQLKILDFLRVNEQIFKKFSLQQMKVFRMINHRALFLELLRDYSETIRNVEEEKHFSYFYRDYFIFFRLLRIIFKSYNFRNVNNLTFKANINYCLIKKWNYQWQKCNKIIVEI